MKAAIRRTYGLPEIIAIEEVQRPVPNDRQVLIKVHATTVNRTDCANLTANPFFMRIVLGLGKPSKKILGTDFAGEIIQKGKYANHFDIGQRVFGFVDTGAQSHAEYTVVDEEQVFAIPNNIDYKMAAASLEGAHYAYTFVTKAHVQPDHRVFINGATCAIGSALLQFVTAIGAKVTATSNPENIKLITKLGADKVYDYNTNDMMKDSINYDFFFDAVGKSTYKKAGFLLKKRGVYISSELGAYGQNVFLSLMSSLLNKKVIFPVPLSTKQSVPHIQKVLEDGTFKPVVDRIYNLADIKQAFQYVIKGHKTGNVVLSI